jgi:hypothetical protein
MSGTTTYQYILSLQDKMSATLKKASYLGGKEYDKLQAKQERLNKSVAGFGNLLGTIGITSGIFAVISLMHTGVEKAEALHQAEAQVRAGILSTKAAAGVAVDEIEKMSGAMSKTMLYSKSDIMSMQSVLLTFPKISNKVFGEASQAIMDMSTRMRQDPSHAAVMVGKALQDPIGGVMMLRRVGVNFTKEQSEGFKKLVEQGKLYEAQVAILAELNTEFGGSARAAFDANPMARFRKAIESIQLTFGEFAMKIQSKLAPVMEKLAGMFNYILHGTGFLHSFGKYLLITIGFWKGYVIVTSIASAVSVWYERTIRKINASLWVMNKRVGGAGAAMGVYSGLTGVASLATKLFANSFKALGKAIYGVPIFGWILAGITAIVTAFTVLWNKSEKFRGIIFGIWEVTKVVFSGLFTFFKTVVQGIGGVFTWLREKVFKPVFEWFKNMFGWLIGLFDKILQGIGFIFKPIVALWNKLTKSKFVLDIKSNFSKGYEKGVENFRSSKKKKGVGDLIPGMNDSGLGSMGDLGETPSGVDDTSKGIAEGGSRPTNINLTVGNLVESLNITPATMKEGAAELQRVVQEALLRVLNSANGVAYGN